MLEKEEIKIGVKCTGKVSRIMSYGAFVEISEGKDGLCHISEFSTARIENLESVVSVGDPLEVMILNIDDQGRIDLSHRAVAFDEDFETVKERRDSARKRSFNRGSRDNYRGGGGSGGRGGYGGSRDNYRGGGGSGGSGGRGGYGGSRDNYRGGGGESRGGYGGSRDRDNFRGGGGEGRGDYGGGSRGRDNFRGGSGGGGRDRGGYGGSRDRR